MERIKLFHRRVSPEKGQSMAEIAIIAPLLIFMMIGVFEVGWALRGYLVLINVNREITRFAIRPGYMDFSTHTSVISSYNRVRDWVDTSLSGQLDLDFEAADVDGDEANATLIISHLVVDTGEPCPNMSPSTDCGCISTNPFPQDDLIIHPAMPGFEYQSTLFGRGENLAGNPVVTRIDYSTVADRMTAENNTFNCDIIKRGGVASANNVIITELFYDQPQLFGFPLISNPFTDPVPLYAHTTMRLISAARSSGTEKGNLTDGIGTIGPVCFAYPMLAPNKESLIAGQQINIVQNGWLKWNASGPEPPLNNDEEYVEASLLFPQMSVSDFQAAGGGTGSLKKGSSVAKVTSNLSALQDELEALGSTQVLIPTSNNPTATPVTVNDFVWVTLIQGQIEPGNGVVMASVDLTRSVPEACQ
ncbi:MAG TPA: pilus assembly protein [Anaerolineae bacterium]|nr:pilus assembly protein [Anaerolineae bacterium]